jgi:hypothetical protein
MDVTCMLVGSREVKSGSSSFIFVKHGVVSTRIALFQHVSNCETAGGMHHSPIGKEGLCASGSACLSTPGLLRFVWGIHL